MSMSMEEERQFHKETLERCFELEKALRGILRIVDWYIPDMSEFVETDEWRAAWDVIK